MRAPGGGGEANRWRCRMQLRCCGGTAAATASWLRSGAAAHRVSGSPLGRTSCPYSRPWHIHVPLAPDTRRATSSASLPVMASPDGDKATASLFIATPPTPTDDAPVARIRPKAAAGTRGGGWSDDVGAASGAAPRVRCAYPGYGGRLGDSRLRTYLTPSESHWVPACAGTTISFTVAALPPSRRRRPGPSVFQWRQPRTHDRKATRRRGGPGAWRKQHRDVLRSRVRSRTRSRARRHTPGLPRLPPKPGALFPGSPKPVALSPANPRDYFPAAASCHSNTVPSRRSGWVPGRSAA